MKSKAILICSLLIFFGVLAANSQEAVKIEGKHLKDLAGNWKGELIYLDYRDDKSRVTLKVRTINVWAKSNLTRNIVFTEPNGKEIKSDSVLTIADDNLGLLEDKEKWRVVKNSYDREKKQRIIVLETAGEDNDKKADLRKTLVIRKNEYTVTKEVRYKGSSDYIFRNEFRFSKAE